MVDTTIRKLRVAALASDGCADGSSSGAEEEDSQRARCVPSPQREEGQVEGFGRWSFILTFRTPSPRPLPSGEREITIVAVVTFLLTSVPIAVTVQSGAYISE